MMCVNLQTMYTCVQEARMPIVKQLAQTKDSVKHIYGGGMRSGKTMNVGKKCIDVQVVANLILLQLDKHKCVFVCSIVYT